MFGKLFKALQKHEKKKMVPPYPFPLNHQPAVKDMDSIVPVSEMLSKSVLSIPLNAYMDEESQVKIISTIKSCFT